MVLSSTKVNKKYLVGMQAELILSQKTLSERGKKILDAAQQLFLEHGYDNTSLEMIISEAGGSRRNIYSEFGNKEGLLIAVIKEHIAAQVSLLVDIDYDLPPEEALTKVCCRFMDGFLSETVIKLFRLVINIVPTLPQLGELIFHYGPLTGCRPISDYLAYLNKQGVLLIDDSEFAAHLLIEMIKSRLHVQALLLPNNPPTKAEISAHVRQAVPVFLRAYKV
ncbi:MULTISPECIES: TetR/AcrR family transcriptional regulator [Thalassotalea]|uniref:TetR/AcrR family transcriptional regulator n=1 Tax=Thalassotalea TaxID=1518149 RepID=UPI002573D84B|nr:MULTISPECIES: TetR/AcrR family transcriptional regulator [Thalassotalea]